MGEPLDPDHEKLRTVEARPVSCEGSGELFKLAAAPVEVSHPMRGRTKTPPEQRNPQKPALPRRRPRSGDHNQSRSYQLSVGRDQSFENTTLQPERPDDQQSRAKLGAPPKRQHARNTTIAEPDGPLSPTIPDFNDVAELYMDIPKSNESSKSHSSGPQDEQDQFSKVSLPPQRRIEEQPRQKPAIPPKRRLPLPPHMQAKKQANDELLDQLDSSI